jgi:hypothetical protein
MEMNERQAREILGCSKSASYKELRAAYRRMIVMVHPDKAEQDVFSQERAREASSRLNYAWEYLERREKEGSLGKADSEPTTTNYQAPRGRATYPHECQMCGFAPATKISAPMVSSFLYSIRRGKYELNACKPCGLAMSRMALRETLIKGWWGLGLIFVPHAIYRYIQNIRALNRIDLPTHRDPDVATLSQSPSLVPRSPLREPAPLIATAVALTIIASLISTGGPSSSSEATPSMYFGQVGSCYKEVSTAEGSKIQMIDCTSPTATLKSIAITDANYLCPTGTLATSVANLPDGTVKRACLGSV